MCGIFGLWRKDLGPADPELVRALTDILAHRGPDSSGVVVDGRLGLGHRRLKILDLSDTANQPFTDGRHTLVFNGEIFNHAQLRRELAGHYRFRTTSDTEVLFRALCRGGAGVLPRLDGQYAFAFHDPEAQTLLLARDHVGICPLYIYQDDALLAFSSEIRPLLHLAGPRPLDLQGVADYFTYRYTIQNGRTLFDGITRFAPGHFMTVDLRSGRTETRRYWSLLFDTPMRPEDVQSALDAELDAVMADQSMADVPVGLFLSGGIDSRAVLHGFSKQVPRVRAFTLGFGERNSEVAQAEALAKRYSIEMHIARFTQDVAEGLPEAVRILEEPFGDLIICANDQLARLAAGTVRVVLSGEGGDESFFGYAHQRSCLKLLGLSRFGLSSSTLSALLGLAPARLLGLLADYPGGFGSAEKAHLRRVLAASDRPEEAYLAMVRLFSAEALGGLMAPDFLRNGPGQADTKPILDIFSEQDNPVHASMRAEIEQLTLVVNLTKQDRFTMAHGLEARVPLVSKRILGLAARIPPALLTASPAKAMLQRYSGAATLAKKPFSILVSPGYRSMLLALFDMYAGPRQVAGQRLLRQDGIARMRAGLKGGGLLEIKQAMAVIVFFVWLDVFSPYIKEA